MKWYDIVFDLLEDEMINSCGCDGLWDSYRVLNGLFGMSEIMPKWINDEFILEAINASIGARNRYCSLNGAKKLPYVEIKNGEFEWDMFTVCEKCGCEVVFDDDLVTNGYDCSCLVCDEDLDFCETKLVSKDEVKLVISEEDKEHYREYGYLPNEKLDLLEVC